MRLCQNETLEYVNQSLIQDLGTGCPKLAILKLLGVLFFKGHHNMLRLQTNMYLLNEIKHNVHIQCHWNLIELEKFNDMLEIDISRNSSLIVLGVMKGDI